MPYSSSLKLGQKVEKAEKLTPTPTIPRARTHTSLYLKMTRNELVSWSRCCASYSGVIRSLPKSCQATAMTSDTAPKTWRVFLQLLSRSASIRGVATKPSPTMPHKKFARELAITISLGGIHCLIRRDAGGLPGH